MTVAADDMLGEQGEPSAARVCLHLSPREKDEARAVVEETTPLFP